MNLHLQLFHDPCGNAAVLNYNLLVYMGHRKPSLVLVRFAALLSGQPLPLEVLSPHPGSRPGIGAVPVAFVTKTGTVCCSNRAALSAW